MQHSTVFWALFLSLFASSYASRGSPRAMRVDTPNVGKTKACTDTNEGNCQPPDLKVLPKVVETCMDNSIMELQDIDIRRIGKNNYTLVGSLNLLKNIEEDGTLKIDVYRCTDESSRDNCEHFATFKYEKFCSMCGEKDRFWTPVIKRMPSLTPCHCPMKVGIYEVDQAVITIDPTTANMPLLEGYFIVNIYLYTVDENSPLSCILLEANLYKSNE